MYTEISSFWNHQSFIYHPNWLYFHVGIIDAGAQTKMYKTCSCCGRDTWHIWSKHILQPPKYLIIIVNRIIYSNNRIIKNKIACLWIDILSWVLTIFPASLYGPSWILYERLSLHSLNQLLGETFHYDDNKITECNITDTYNSSTADILLYKLIMEY